MHRGDALGDAHRTDGAPVVDDRDRGREDLLAERRGGPLDLDLPAGERALDLGPARVAGAELAGPALSASTRPLR